MQEKVNKFVDYQKRIIEDILILSKVYNKIDLSGVVEAIKTLEPFDSHILYNRGIVSDYNKCLSEYENSIMEAYKEATKVEEIQIELPLTVYLEELKKIFT